MEREPGTMIPRKNADTFVSGTLDGELMLLNSRTCRFHGLGGVALAVWQAIDGVRTLGAIQALIAERYAIDRATCFAEVAAFVEDLRREGIVDAG